MSRTGPSRRDVLAAALGAVAAPGLARAAATAPQEDLVLRRTPAPGEDADWYAMGQNGPWNPARQPTVMPFGIARTIVHHPVGPKSGRLVVFSHAALADPQVYRPLLQHLASHGFVVAAPIHDDSAFVNGGALARQVTIQGATWDVDRVMNEIIAWENRVEACRTQIENVDMISSAIGMTVDASRPVIVGHEFGAYVAGLVLGTVVSDYGERITKFKDDRWFAGAMMSAQGKGIMGLSENSWNGVTKPLMVVQAAEEVDSTQQTPQQKVDPFLLSAPRNKHLSWFTQGDRSMYASASSATTDSHRVIAEDLRATLTSFLKAYGDYDAKVFDMITGDWPERATLGRVLASYR